MLLLAFIGNYFDPLWECYWLFSLPFNWSIKKHLAIKVNFISSIFKDLDTNSDNNISNSHEVKKHFHSLLSVFPL